jgi:fibronectin-binding autotransporter adhesin
MKTIKTWNRQWLTAVSAAILFLSLEASQAATYYWDLNGATLGPGTTPNGTWTVGTNWNDTANGSGTLGTAPGALDTAYFTAGASGAQAGASTYTVSLGSASVSVDKITFSSTAPTVIGSSVGDGTITLGTGGISIPRAANGGSGNTSAAATIQSNINLNGDQAWSQDMGLSGNLTISGNVGGTGNLTLTSLRSGRNIVLSGSVNHTGILTTGSQTSNTIVSGNIGSNVTNVSANGNGVLTLSGTNSYTGNSTITGGNSGTAILRVGSNSAIVSTSTITLNSGTNASTSRFDLGDGANSFSATIAGLLNSGTRQGRSVVTNSSSGTGTGTLTINPATANTFSGLIQDGTTAKVAISVGGADTLTLSGANSYTGGTTVSSGTLAVNANAATVTDVTVGSIASGTTTQTATVSSSAGLAIGQAVSASNLAVGTIIIGISGNTLQLSAFATAANTSSGSFSAYQTLGNGAVTTSGTGILDLSGSTTSSVGTVTVSGGTIQNGTLTGTSYATSSGTVTANLAGSGVTLTQNGAGTTALSGTNTYSGATNINTGTLMVYSAGSINSTSGVNVSNGGTFRYNSTTAFTAPLTLASGGTLTGNGNLGTTPISVVAGSTLSPGNSPGSQATGTQTWFDDGNYNWQLLDATGGAGTGYDTYAITGTLDLSNLTGANDFQINLWTLSSTGPDVEGSALNFNPASNYSWILASTTSGVTGFDASEFTINTLANNGTSGFGNTYGGTFDVSVSGNNLLLNYTGVIPEPSTYVLLLGGLGMLAVLRRRTRKYV